MHAFHELEAQLLWKQALSCQSRGEIEPALDLYRRSLALFPTAEAHTYMGWALSSLGKGLDEAIECCKKAIEVDPDFGNPYNDIGCYLMQRNELVAAIPWLEKAKRASRYEPRQYPYLNMGRIMLRMGRFEDARREFSEAVRICPEDAAPRRALQSLVARFN